MKNLLFLVLLFTSLLQAQDNCDGSFKEYFLNANHIRASFLPRGNKFTNGNKPQFQVPFPSDHQASTFFGSSVWIGGFDDAQNFKSSTETYLNSNHPNFSVGPLSTIGSPYDSLCGYFDRAWSVYGTDIRHARLDFMTDFKIDDTLASIFGWPGRGNSYFKRFNGFELPPDGNAGFAPFYDINGNNIYNPDQGDYPMVKISGQELIPDQMVWMVFNDANPYDNISTDSPLRFEIQLTAFAFFCQENSWLNNTIFNSYKIINRAVLAADSVFFGMWSDYDLGCPGDDFMGSDSMRSTEFVYNANGMDGEHPGDCFSTDATYPGIPPVQSLTYLSHPMYSFVTFSDDDQYWLQRYRMMNGQWPDGKPIRPIGDGHSDDVNLRTTRYWYHGDPRDNQSWAAINENENGSDQKSVSSVALGRLDPGQQRVVEMAYIYSHNPNGGHLDQITQMFNNVDSLRNTIANGSLMQNCTASEICEESDCVWPGDFNHDGIADHRDLLAWGVMKDMEGPRRTGNIIWNGKHAEEWTGVMQDTINFKHGDGNGDGKIDTIDLERNEFHHYLTTLNYNQKDLYPEGPELGITSSPLTLAGYLVNFKVSTLKAIPNVYGLAFELEFDTAYFEPLFGSYEIHVPGQMDFITYRNSNYLSSEGASLDTKYAFVFTNHTSASISNGEVLLFSQLKLKPEILLENLPDTMRFRLKNLIAIDAQGNDLHIGSQDLLIINPLITSLDDPIDRSISLYPNPTTGTFRISAEQVQSAQILNAMGILVQSVSIAEFQQPIDISGLVSGIYFLRLDESGEIYKLIKL